jgi:hypothetical protein
VSTSEVFDVVGRLTLTPVPLDPGGGFVLGVTEPTAAGLYTPRAVTGPRVPETSMANYAGDLTNVAPGEVLDRLVISGQFRPESSGWVMRDCITEVGTPPDGESMWPGWDLRDGDVDDGTIEHSEVRPSYNGYEVYGLKGGNVTITRSLIRGTVDGLQPHGSGTYPDTTNKRVTLLGSMVQDLRVFEDPGQSDGIVHGDDLQAAGALDRLLIIGAALHGGRTSCVLLQQNAGLYRVALLALSWLYGDPATGSTFNTSQNGRGPIAAGGLLAVIGNRFSKAGNTPHALVSASTLDSPTFLWFGNTYLEDGTEVTPTRGAD